MDETILTNLYNSTKSGDILYFLGDLTFSNETADNFFRAFKHLKIIFIKGNHDNKKAAAIAKNYEIPVYDLLSITIDTIPLTLCHYAMRTWHKSHFNSYQLHGHSHGTLPPMGKQYDVGVDNNRFFPISWDTLKSILANSPNNLNYINHAL
jgi:calcineurin-like phosphoesterase family protein